MPQSWLNALENYHYPVNLRIYNNANHYHNFFNLNIEGDRDSTIEFENRFRELAKDNIPVYLEVIFWKLFSQPIVRNNTTNRIENHFNKNQIEANQIWQSIQNFTYNPTIENLVTIRNLLGITTPVLTVPLNFVSFSDPLRFPMVDKQVANWVNDNYKTHNKNRDIQLTPFIMNYSSLQDNDFKNYLNWVNWCREIAKLLTDALPNNIKWRARDVEMAIFTAQSNNLTLNVLD